MRLMQMEFLGFGDMEVDDVEELEIVGEGVISIENKLVDADFFNKFEDDFDDTDVT